MMMQDCGISSLPFSTTDVEAVNNVLRMQIIN